MIIKKYYLLLTTALFLAGILPTTGQGIIPATSKSEVVQTGGDTIVILPFESTGITQAFSETNKLIAEIDMIFAL